MAPLKPAPPQRRASHACELTMSEMTWLYCVIHHGSAPVVPQSRQHWPPPILVGDDRTVLQHHTSSHRNGPNQANRGQIRAWFRVPWGGVKKNDNAAFIWDTNRISRDLRGVLLRRISRGCMGRLRVHSAHSGRLCGWFFPGFRMAGVGFWAKWCVISGI